MSEPAEAPEESSLASRALTSPDPTPSQRVGEFAEHVAPVEARPESDLPGPSPEPKFGHTTTSFEVILPEDPPLVADERTASSSPSSEVAETQNPNLIVQTLDHENAMSMAVVHHDSVADETTGEESRETIDLTLDDGDDDAPNNSLSAGSPFQPTKVIKTEEEADGNLLELQVADAVAQDTTMADYGLPAVGATVIPDNDDFDLEHQQSLDQMFLQFNENSRSLNTNQDGTFPEQATALDANNMDDEDNRARQLFKQHKTRYERLKARELTTMEDDIEFHKAENAEKQRRKHYENSKAFNQQVEEENSMFIPEDADSEPEDELTYMGTNALGTGDADEMLQAEAKPQKKVVKAKSRTKISNGRVTKSATKSNVTGRRGRPKKKDAAMHIDLHDLMNNNPIEQGRANEGLEAQPTLGTEKDKRKALVALIASLPEDQRDLHKGDKVKLDKASKGFTGHGAMKADGDKGWLLRGMLSHLRHYQMLGASWMRDRENAGAPLGGILSDTMGFGKTVMCLANMVDGKPPKDSRGARTTLIVAPSNLVSQWLAEIGKHVKRETFPDIIVFRAGSKLHCADPVRTLGNQDIVITSYSEVQRSYPRNEPPTSLHTAEAKAEWWKDFLEKNRGPLHHVKWYRIILDEAQLIKNHKSMTSIAVRALRGKYRWCLTATPIQNTLDEFWAIMNFLREPWAGRSSFELFKQNYTSKGSEKSLERLIAILGKVMLRRTHANKLFNRPVLQLPPIAPVKTIEVEFNTVERQIYRIVRNRFVQKVKLIGMGPGQQQQYQQMFVLLLRLRQLVGHPLLIQKTLKDLMEREDLERLWALTQDYDSSLLTNNPQSDIDADGNIATAQAVHAALQDAESSNDSAGPSGSSNDNEPSRAFRKYLQSLADDGQWAKVNQISLCHACGNPPENPHITSCRHLYCLQCINDLWYSEALRHGPNNDMKATCLDCGTLFDKCDAYQAKGFDEASSRRGTPSNRKTADVAEENIDWFSLPGPILRSAKIKGAMAQIKDWLQQDPTNKIIVFVQFRGMIKVMARVLGEENIRSEQFHGSMSFDARDEAVKRFSERNDTSVLLAALKAGGIGLNLTAANRVIILDLWWNFLTENQAFCRAYRIGQKRDVEVVRFVVKDTVDTDMLLMQERKTKEIDSAMEKKNHRILSVAELMELFKEPELDGDGQPNEGTGEDGAFIFPNDPYDRADMDSDVEMVN